MQVTKDEKLLAKHIFDKKTSKIYKIYYLIIEDHKFHLKMD